MPQRRPSRLQEMIDFAEKQAIEWAFKQTGSVYKSATLLGVSPSHLYKLVAKHELDYMIRQPHRKSEKKKRGSSKKAARSARPAATASAGDSAQDPESTGESTEPETDLRSAAPAEVPADPA